MSFFDHFLTDRPELLALTMLFFGIFANRWSGTSSPAARLMARVPIFLTFTYFLVQAHQIPYLMEAHLKGAFERVLGDGLRALWWFWAASIGSNLIRNFSYRGSQLSGHRFFTDLCVAGCYMFAFIGFITFVLNFPIQGLLVTSGAVAVVLGLALQSSLGDVFYGIVLNLGKPYREGNWISLDIGVEGRVVEMNWRATHMLTTNQDVVIVPNSVVGKAKIVNSSFPSRIHGTTISVLLAPNTFPSLARRMLKDAIHGCPLALSTPPPVITIKSMSQEAIAFEVTFFTSNIDESTDAQNQVHEKIFRCLGAMGIGLGSRTTAMASTDASAAPSDLDEVERLVAFTPVFSRLPPAERHAIAASMVRATFAAGETVIKYGVVSEAIYVVGHGVLTYSHEIAGSEVEITRMTTADHFGAAGLLNGTPTAGKITAVTPAAVYRLEKSALLRLVQARPGFAADLDRELAARQLLVEGIANAQDSEDDTEERLANWFSNLFRPPTETVRQRR